MKGGNWRRELFVNGISKTKELEKFRMFEVVEIVQ